MALKAGAPGIKMVKGAAEVNKIEPKVQAIAAIHFPTSGVVCSHSLMKHFEGVAQSNGALVLYGKKVVDAKKMKNNEGYNIIIEEKDG